MDKSSEWKMPDWAFPKHGGQTQSQVFSTSFLDDLGDNVVDIVLSLTEKYQDFMAKGEFQNTQTGFGGTMTIVKSLCSADIQYLWPSRLN